MRELRSTRNVAAYFNWPNRASVKLGVSSKVRKNRKTALGGSANVLPALYTWANAQYTAATAPVYFHDVTGGTAGLFAASTGYDLITGAGSPLADKVINGLAAL